MNIALIFFRSFAALLNISSASAGKTSLSVMVVVPWVAVWEGIENASATTDLQPKRSRSTIVLRFWPVGAAAAALMLAVGLWRVGHLPGSRHNMQLSSHVEVHEIEVFGDATTFVALDEDGGAAMIWVVQDEGA